MPAIRYTSQQTRAFATFPSELLMALFVETESLFSCFRVLEKYLRRHGRSVRVLTGKHAFFRHSGHSEGQRTRFVEVLEVLEILIIFSSSPQSRGRVERAHWTAQNRLVKLLLRHVYPEAKAPLQDREKVTATLNRYLTELYIPMYNAKFAVAAELEGDSHQLLTDEQIASFPMLLCKVTLGTMDLNGMVRYGGDYYKTKRKGDINSYARKSKPAIDMRHHYRGAIHFIYGNREIEMVVARKAVKKDIPEVTSKQLNETYRTQEPPKPVKGHSPPHEPHLEKGIVRRNASCHSWARNSSLRLAA